MKTPYYSGSFTVAQHSGFQDDDQLRERMLEYRLADRDDVREISIVTALPFSERLKSNPTAQQVVNMASERSKSDLSWAMHWAIQVGDQFFELQRGYPDPLRTGLRVGKWDQQKQSQIHQRYRQGVTAMTDDEIKAVGESHFARLDRIDINIYDIWCNNCQIAVDRMLRDIGGLCYYRRKLESLHEMVRQFFYDAILSILTMYGRFRGWNEELIIKYTHIIHKTLRVMTARSEYPKRHWIRSDIDMAEGTINKMNTVKDHWFLSVLESSLSLRKGSDELYVRRGADGKPELNFTALKEATKGIFDDDEKDWRVSWLKALPWLTGGFLIGTPRWAAAVISIAISRASQLYEDRVGLKGGLEDSLIGVGFSPNPQYIPSISSTRPNLQGGRKFTTGQRRVRSKTHSIDSKLVPRYERCLTAAGVPYFLDHLSKSQTWDPPDHQEMCIRVTDPPLSRRWEEKREENRTLYVNRINGDVTEIRPGPTEVWAIKKKVKPDWLKSSHMALPHGWEMRRTDEGEKYYLNHNLDPPTSTTYHPMRKEIEDERLKLLPEWNVEWDDDRGKKYRNIQSGEIRWKTVDGPQYVSNDDKARITLGKSDGFTEPLPPGWTSEIRHDGQNIFKNGKTGKERMERTTHPLSDKRRRLQPEWEMRYTPGGWRYWVHHGSDGRGTAWWRRNRLLKNTSLKNNASGWKLAEGGHEWEWFEGGDVLHSEIPVLDLDDPAELEFREYPFVLPLQTVTDDGAFIEPLPSEWVRRTNEDGGIYFWNYKEEVRSEQHPNEEEREDLPALWAMRYTRHGRRYFIDHEDGSTWWTHPRDDKHEQKLRARPGQSQNGWKIAEDSRTWERFEEHQDAQTTEEGIGTSSYGQSNESDMLREERRPVQWRSLSFTRQWIKTTGSNEVIKRVNSNEVVKRITSSDMIKNFAASDVVAHAKSRIPKTPRFFRQSDFSPSIDSTLMESPQEDDVEDRSERAAWLKDIPRDDDKATYTADPEEEAPSLESSSVDFAQNTDEEELERELFSQKALTLLGHPHRDAKEEPDSKNSPLKDTNANGNLQRIEESDSKEQELAKEEHPQISDENLSENTERLAEERHLHKDPDDGCPLPKQSKKHWTQRTTSGLLAMKKNVEKKAGERGIVLPKAKFGWHRDSRSMVDGLGIMGAETTDQGETPEKSKISTPTDELIEDHDTSKVGKDEELGSR